MSAPPPKSGWKASPDLLLRDLLLQMAELQVDFVEIPFEATTVSVVVGPTAKQAGLRDTIAHYKARK